MLVDLMGVTCASRDLYKSWGRFRQQHPFSPPQIPSTAAFSLPSPHLSFYLTMARAAASTTKTTKAAAKPAAPKAAKKAASAKAAAAHPPWADMIKVNIDLSAVSSCLRASCLVAACPL